MEQILISMLAVINIFSFLVIATDKRKAMQGGNTERISEGNIFFLATVFGSVGVYAGMVAFRHKTRKWYFGLGIPLLIMQNLATLYVIRDILIIN